MSILIRQSVWSIVLFSLGLLSYLMGASFHSGVPQLVMLFPMVVGPFLGCAATLKLYRMYRFMKASPKTTMRIIRTPYEFGSFFPREGREYNFLGHNTLNLERSNSIPPYKEEGTIYLVPFEVTLNNQVYMRNKNGHTSEMLELPIILCEWPSGYKSPATKAKEKSYNEFRSGLHQAHLLSDGKHGKPMPHLE